MSKEEFGRYIFLLSPYLGPLQVTGHFQDSFLLHILALQAGEATRRRNSMLENVFINAKGQKRLINGAWYTEGNETIPWQYLDLSILLAGYKPSSSNMLDCVGIYLLASV